MARVWLFNGRAIARKVRNASGSSDDQIKDHGAGANWECPECHRRVDTTDEWPGYPAGVKFDPSDLELIEHLAAKSGVGGSKPHVFVEEFIPTLHEEKGICYTHPETLPGAKKDGSCIYFFHKISNAYATGQRKRRKIQSGSTSTEGPVRWHKTGKTKPVQDSHGVHKGYKKIMVLYKSSKKGSKPNKSKWVMHQYHLGTDEDEKESEYVVSKVFYQQPKQDDHNDEYQVAKESNALPIQTCPRTPNPNPPNPPRLQSGLLDDLIDDKILQPTIQDREVKEEANQVPPVINIHAEDEVNYSALAGESQSDFGIGNALLCSEKLNPNPLPHNSVQNPVSDTVTAANSDEVNEYNGAPCGIDDLENLDFDIPPGFPYFQFGSQDSILDWFAAH